MKRLFSALIFSVGLSTFSFGQAFVPPFEVFSSSKVAYVTLEDGNMLEGTIHDIDRRKGLIQEITIKDATNKKIKLTADKIKYMYLPPSNFAKYAAADDYLMKANKWGRAELNKDILKKGYAYFEKSSVKLRKSEEELLLQLLNPLTSNRIRVYHDPLAQETNGVNLSGIQLSGGDDRSYFVKVGDKPAFKLLKKNYDDEFANLYGDCPTFIQKAGRKIKWVNFDQHVADYTTECGLVSQK